eukprot:GHVU01234594.1.p2 GENE.GHVU01234594.1~~GHVU01234594.1.p2  ORF type:complete len:104 (-),score=7.93 GHVU01234594.1:293-604(-)
MLEIQSPNHFKTTTRVSCEKSTIINKVWGLFSEGNRGAKTRYFPRSSKQYQVLSTSTSSTEMEASFRNGPPDRREVRFLRDDASFDHRALASSSNIRVQLEWR